MLGVSPWGVPLPAGYSTKIVMGSTSDGLPCLAWQPATRHTPALALALALCQPERRATMAEQVQE